MKTPWIAIGLCTLATACTQGQTHTQGHDPAATYALPWGPPVARPLHNAALTYRQRALEQCFRTRVAHLAQVTQAALVDSDAQSCIDALVARVQAPAAVARLQR